MLPAVELRGVGKTFYGRATLETVLRLRVRGRPVRALEAVDLAVGPGQALALLGLNGAGKTTLLRLVAGLLLPTDGAVEVRGRVGYVPADERGLTPHLSPREHLALFAACHGLARLEALARADALVDEVGLRAAARRPIRELSTGMRRRVTLARGLLGEPTILLLDEPTRGVDPAGTDVLHALVERRREAGTTLLVATHDQAEARRLCSAAAVLDGARLEPPVTVDDGFDRLRALGAAGAHVDEVAHG